MILTNAILLLGLLVSSLVELDSRSISIDGKTPSCWFNPLSSQQSWTVGQSICQIKSRWIEYYWFICLLGYKWAWARQIRFYRKQAAWLREIGGIDHRGYNPAFINEMTVFVSEIVTLVQDLLHDQGGPIVLLQIENEYGNFIGKYPDGQSYIERAT